MSCDSAMACCSRAMSPVNAKLLMLPSCGCSFDIIVVPLAVNMPPTTWQTEILAPGIWAGREPRIWRALFCNGYMPYIRNACRRGRCHWCERQFPAGAVLCPAPASPRGTKPRSSRP